jgi:hypothetical protein
VNARHQLLVSTVLGILAGGAALLAARQAGPHAGAVESPPRPPARLESRGWDHADLWPVHKSWVWTVDPIGTKPKSGVCVRTTSRPIPPGEEPAAPAVAPLPATGEDRRPGWSATNGLPVSGRITCQLINLRELGLVDAKHGPPLRLLVQLRSGGGLMGLTGPNAVLPGDHWIHLQEHRLRWEGDILRLLTLYTRTADTLFVHDVFVEQSDAG